MTSPPLVGFDWSDPTHPRVYYFFNLTYNQNVIANNSNGLSFNGMTFDFTNAYN